MDVLNTGTTRAVRRHRHSLKAVDRSRCERILLIRREIVCKCIRRIIRRSGYLGKHTLSYHLLGSLLSLSDSKRRFLSLTGINPDVFAAYDELIVAPQFRALPLRARRHWVRQQLCRNATGEDVASNIPGFHPFLLPAECWPRFPDLMLAEGGAPRATILPVVTRRGVSTFTNSVSVGLHIHVFFTDGLEAVRAALNANHTRPQLYVTGPYTNRQAVLQAFADHQAPVEFIPCSNVGRDVVPFLTLLPRMRADGHDLIGHIHTKGSSAATAQSFVQRWSNFLLSSLIGDVSNGLASIDNILADLSSAPASRTLYIPQMTEALGWGPHREVAKQLFARLHHGHLPERFLFSAGTMFWATPNYFHAFESLDLPWADMAPEPLPSDGTVLHAMERLFWGVSCLARGSDSYLSVKRPIFHFLA